MKKTILLILLLVFFSKPIFASHLMGGEITWQCQPNGQFVFKMILYRDCSGIPMPTGTQTLDVYGNPNLLSINLNQSSITDITYCQPTYNCDSIPPAGATEEGIFISNPITLNGVPPTGGWTFVWHSCCRNGAMSNLQPNGFTLRATMYPVNGLNANPCYDSSPEFAEKPYSILCSGKAFVFNHGAFDADHDSLSFTWGQPLEEPSSPPPAPWNPGTNPSYATFNPPYTYLNPLPFNPPNIGATLDTLTGEFNFKCHIGGNFVTSVKVSSYKCGVLASEIFREIELVVLGNCPNLNNNPAIDPPFQDSSGYYTLFADTVMAGDSVFFNLNASDFDFNINGLPQTVILSGYGSQFGLNLNDPDTGCLIPPCAVIDVPMPATDTTTLSVNFGWKTTSDHLGLYYLCAYLPNTYFFNFKALDNNCPIPAVHYKTVSITVLPTYPRPGVTHSNNILNCLAPGFNYQWYFNRFPINGATGQSYHPTQTGAYQVRITDSIGSGNYSDPYYVSTINVLVNEISGLESLKLYPNPANDLLNIEFTENFNHPVTLTLYDITGRPVFEKFISNANGKMKFEISLKEMNSGIYTFEIGNGMENLRRKVVVAKN